ncbi:MAG: hypothetical protein CMF74_02850 [Maricaulis sp.]|nr:hypothetical protein [Maricaulis sp.]HAQ34743.1 hypothetical protein [Alphaproteobacteria bacterium]
MLRALLVSTALILPAAAASPALAQDQSAMHHTMHEGRLTLTATGNVRVAPDMATVSAGVVTEAATAAEALSANSRAMNGVFSALRQAGVAERDIQTSNLQISPVWSGGYSSERGETERRITGYQATNTVTARVSDLDNLGRTVDALVSSGANQLQGVNFGLEDRDDAMNEARRRAVAELGALRTLYAGALGVELGRLVEFSEGSNYSPPQPMMYARTEMMNDSTPVAAGQLDVSVTVTAVYAIAE